MLRAGDWSARVRVARRLLAQAWLPTPAGWLAFRTPSLPLPPLRLPRPQQESVISWAWHHYPIYRQRYAAAARDPRFTHLTFHRIATRADANHLLASAC